MKIKYTFDNDEILETPGRHAHLMDYGEGQPLLSAMKTNTEIYIDKKVLTHIQVGWANKKISELYPIADIPIESLFTSLGVFSPIIK